MICPNCATINGDNARFCIECGQPLPRVCPNCGAVNPGNARFCNQCGTPLGEPAPAIRPGRVSGGLAARTGARTPAQSGTSAPTAPASPSTANGTYAPAATAPIGATAAAPAKLAEVPASLPLAVAGGGTGLASEHDEQRRVVTVLFADLTSSTALADGMDPEDVRMLLAGFFAMMAQEIHRHGGTVEKYIGDAVMAVFGLPYAHEDDPLRAIRAALGMQDALRRYNAERRTQDTSAPELSMRIGVNTGEVVAASGAAEGRDFLITGDPVNVAARLQQAAAPGAVLVGPRTYRGTSGAVVYRWLPPLELRGKQRPVRVWEVVAMAEEGAVPMVRPRGVQGKRTPLVGRDVELDLLRSIYSRVLSERRPHLVTIIGNPGVGKTRLAREFFARTERRAEAEGKPRPLELKGRCPPYGEGITYWPLAEMLRAYCNFGALDAPEATRGRLLACVRETLQAINRQEDPELVAAYLGYTIGVESNERRRALLPADSQQLQEGIWRSWRVFFEGLAAHHPLLVLVDDIHWADEALLDLLDYVVTRAEDVSLLLVCPARPELLERRSNWGGGKRNYVTLGLEPLSERDAERLVGELLPPDTPDSLRRGILEKAEGNPFYVEEIVRMLVDRGILVRNAEASGVWRVAPQWEESDEVSDPAIPDTVQGVLAARLDLLTDDERDILQHGAVIGRYFWPSALQWLHPSIREERLTEVLDALRTRDLIHESARPESTLAPAGEPIYTFTHALTREVTYATIPRTRRAHEHERVAEALEELAQGREAEFADLLAQHYRQYYVQGNLVRSRNTARRQAVREKVVYYLALAGDQAAVRHASTKAERAYTEALALLAEDAVSEDVPRRVELYMKRGDVRWRQVHADVAWADYREALRLWSAYTLFTVDGVTPERQPGGAIAAPVAADGAPAMIAEMPAATGSQTPATVLPLDWRAWGLRLYRHLVLLPTRYASLFQQPAAHEELRQILDEGLRLAEELGQRDTLEGAELLTAKAFFWWSWGEQRGEAELLEALRSAREAVRITESLGNPRAASAALDALGSMQAITTDLRGALESQTRRLVWARRLDDTNEVVDIHASACMAFEHVGDYAAAVEHGNDAVTLAHEADADVLLAIGLRCLTVAYFDWDRWPEAIETGERLLAVRNTPGVVHSDQHRVALLALATAYARTGRRDESDAVAQRLLAIPSPVPVQFLAVYRARLAMARGATKEARQLLLDALEARSGRMALPTLLAELAELGARSGDRAFYERFGAQAQELGWRSGARKALAQAVRARGIVAVADARWEDALGDFDSALTRYAELGTAWEEARTRYALAGCYRRRNASGDEALAQEELARALRLFESLHAVRDLARTKAALAGGDVRLP